MSQYTSAKLITPPREEESIYPYRRVWRSLTIELGVLFALTVLIYGAVGIAGFGVPRPLSGGLNIALALTPAALWGIFSLWAERRVPEGRRHLLGIAVISALTANAIAIPVLDWLQPAQWLTFTGVFDRILGYAFTVGIIQIGLQYLVVRFITWPDAYRIREDAIAFTTASAVGYITVLNLYAVWVDAPNADVVALRVFTNTSLALLAAVVLAYGLAELRFQPKLYYTLPLTLLIAAVLIGVGITFRTNFSSGGFVLGVGGTRPLFGLGFSAGLVFAGMLSMLFLFNVSERQSREAREGRGE
ncbi:MAG: hypothetical protein EA396_03700 [Anaerolineaceae bacterium]|nr:MAG: hypothetical protein EA396_03700 [Anaerolineaceae bacterium]